MKTAKLLDDASAEALAFEWLRSATAPAGAYGERVFAELRPFVPGEERQASLRARSIAALGEDRERDLDAIRELLRNTADAAAAIARASMGDVLEDAQLFELQRFCETAIQVDRLLGGAVAPAANDAVRALADATAPGISGAFGFYLADGFDAELAAARSSLAQVQAAFDAARGREIARVSAALGREELSGEEFIVLREDFSGTLPPGVRTLREAPTYLLCAVEYGESVLQALQRRDAAADAVATSEERVRRAISERVRADAASLSDAARRLGEIDVLVSGARFCRRYRCTVARLAPEPRLAFFCGRFLPLAAELEREGRALTPIDVDLHDVAVLTGPNMGGKTACLRTCGFIALCASFGLPVPAQSAHVSLFDEIAWVGVGTHWESEGLLSSFAREVVRLRDVLKREGRMLMLVDEFARTTTPQEGRALLVALLAHLREREACGFAATHLGDVAPPAGVRHFAVRGLRATPRRLETQTLEEALVVLAQSMDYRIAEVTGENAIPSDAIALADLLGMDSALVAKARDVLGIGRE